MKGLIYKDFTLTKKHIILGYIYFLISIAILVMIQLSMYYGNIAKSDDVENLKNMKFIFRYVPPVIILIDLAIMSVFPFDKDEICGWNKYCFSGPVTNKMMIGERYLFSAILMLTAYVTGFIYVLLFSLISGDGFNLNMLRNLTIILLIAVWYVYIYIPFYLIITDKKKRTVIVTALGIIIYGGFMLYSFSLVKELDGREDIELMSFLRDKFTPSLNTVFIVLAAAAVVIIPLGYLLSDKLMKRGEE